MEAVVPLESQLHYSRMSSTSRALGIEHILEMIFLSIYKLDSLRNDPAGEGYLYCCVLVSKAWARLACRHLWTEYGKVSTLLKLMYTHPVARRNASTVRIVIRISLALSKAHPSGQSSHPKQLRTMVQIRPLYQGSLYLQRGTVFSIYTMPVSG